MEITTNIFYTIMEVLNTVLNYIFSFLPRSPFTSAMDTIGEIPYLGYINYFIPIKGILAITTIWLTAVGIFYVYQIVLRWIKAVDS